MNPAAPLLLAVILAFSLAAPASARAGDTGPARPDRVVLALAVEGWLETETARVRVAVDSAMQGTAAAAARGSLKAALAGLVPGAVWHVTRFTRGRDAAGLERWHLEAQARVPEPGLDGLADRAKAASRPGRQVKVLAIDFTPTLAERETLAAALRSKIYAQAKAELGRLNTALEGQHFRVRLIDFTGLGRPGGPMPRRDKARVTMARAARAQAAVGGAQAPLAVAERVVLRATVVLAAQGKAPDTGN